MFIRGRERAVEVWHRFLLPLDGFVIVQRDGIFEARIVANADRAVDLFLSLSRHLSASVHLALADVREGRRWRGENVSRSDAQEAIARLHLELVRHAGVECALLDAQDQVTLSPHLEVFVYARTDRWYYYLRDLGLRRYRSLAPRSWRPAPDGFPSAPSLHGALRELAERLALTTA